jgi:hypothetical protein
VCDGPRRDLLGNQVLPAGRKPRTEGWSGDRASKLSVDRYAKASACSTRAVREKVQGGAAVHSGGKVGSESPKKADATGHGRWLGLNHLSGAADPGLEQRPEVDATRLGVVGQPATETRRQRREVSGHRRGGTAGSGEEPRSRNPGRGSRAKQICKVQRGANRRERAKRCGRNEGEPGSSLNGGLAGLTPR